MAESFLTIMAEYCEEDQQRISVWYDALQKAGLTADQVWYCGDDFEADVMGAHGVGMFPVLYECREVELFNPVVNERPECEFEYLHIHEWKEMMDVLRGL